MLIGHTLVLQVIVYCYTHCQVLFIPITYSFTREINHDDSMALYPPPPVSGVFSFVSHTCTVNDLSWVSMHVSQRGYIISRDQNYNPLKEVMITKPLKLLYIRHFTCLVGECRWTLVARENWSDII